MLERLFPHKKERVALVADIGSGSAAVAIARISKHRTIISHGMRMVLPFEERTEEQTIAGVGQKLKEAGEKVLAAYAGKYGVPEGGVAIIRSPWARSVSARKEVDLPREMPITSKTIEGVALEAMAQEIGLNHSQTFEAGIVRIELNGYPTNKPKGLVAHTVTTTVLESDCDPRIARLTSETLGALIPGRPIQLRSGVRALVSAARDRLFSKRSYLLVDMTSEATAFTAINRNAIEGHVVIQVGVRTILKKLSGAGSPEEMFSLMRMVGLEQCSDKTCATVAEALTALERELVKSFGETMTKLAEHARLPTTLVLAVHPDMSLWLSRFFSRLDFSQFTATTRPFAVELFTAEELRDRVTFAPGVPHDTGLAVGAAVINSGSR